MPEADQNAQLTEFLKYYVNLFSPQYAVMLQAPWGAGKTWFIKEFIKTLTPQPIYVTLNGVSSKAEIEDQFFEQMHPLLAHKATKMGAKILKGIVRGTIQFDLDGDGKTDGSAAIGVPDVGITEVFSKSKNGSILVFDDVERCELPIHQLLGYINYFVEHNDSRVVLLANEEEILAKEKREAPTDNTKEELQYLRVREKLIGKTFVVRPDINGALDKFLGEVVDNDAKKILTQERSLITELHASSKSNNLRHLRQAILDFERIVLAISLDTRNADMLQGILATFFVYTFEIRSGNFRADQLPVLDSWINLLSSGDQGVNQKLQEKYPQLGTLDSVLPSDLWSRIMSSGLIDRTAVASAIGQSRYYATEKQRPDWLCLNDAFVMDDEPLAALISKVVVRLQNREYKALGEVMHITGSLISLASIGVAHYDTTQIVAWAIANVEEQKANGAIPLSDQDVQLFSFNGWAGRGFHAGDDPVFVKFLEKVELIKSEAKLESYPQKAEKLLKLLRDKDAESFAASLSWNRGEIGQYARDPVLASIKPEDFVDAINTLNSSQLAMVGRAIKSRFGGDNSEIKFEKVWLKNVSLLMEPLALAKGAMSDFYKKVLRDTIISAFENLPD